MPRDNPRWKARTYSRVRRNSSISSAGSVSIFVEPRAPRPTDTFATVAISGASTTFTKSNLPSVAHWWSTLHPSSSTSLLTSRSRSGFDLSVVTPCCVSVDRRMKMGIAASPSVGCGGAYPGCLVEIQQRAADEEEWTEDEVGRGEGDPLAVVSLRVQERAERVPGDADNDDERRERAERVHVVGDAELAAAGEGVAERAPLDHRRRDGEADEREPRGPREDEQRTQGRERQVDEERDDDRRPADGRAQHEPARPDVGGDEERCDGPEDEHLHRPGLADAELVGDDKRQAEWEHAPELMAVGADRLRDELADRAVSGRQRRRQLRHRRPPRRAPGARRRAAPSPRPSASGRGRAPRPRSRARAPRPRERRPAQPREGRRSPPSPRPHSRSSRRP